MNHEALSLLRCPICRTALELCMGGGRMWLECRPCPRSFAIDYHGIVQLVVGASDPQTQASFGYEWTHFADWRPSGIKSCEDYFTPLIEEHWDAALDAGCGMGRHARYLAWRANTVVALDFSQAIESAAQNLADLENVQCVHGDIMRSPLADDVFDFACVLGVLHHLRDPLTALRNIVRSVKPGGRVRVYVYWERYGVFGVAIRLVSALRVLTTRLPFAVTRAISLVLSVLLWATVLPSYRIMRRFGVRLSEAWPLVGYLRYPFVVLYNDQFDRLSVPIERRYSLTDVFDLLSSAGLSDIRAYAKHGWIADGMKP